MRQTLGCDELVKQVSVLIHRVQCVFNDKIGLFLLKIRLCSLKRTPFQVVDAAKAHGEEQRKKLVAKGQGVDHVPTHPKLREFRVVESTDITDAGLGWLGKCTELVHLDLRQAQQVGPRGLLSIAQGCPNLEELNLSFWGQSKLAFDSLVQPLQHWPQLRVLNLDNTSRLGSDATLVALAAHCPLLERLNVSNCIDIKTTGVKVCVLFYRISVVGNCH